VCVYGDVHGRKIKIPKADCYFLVGDMCGVEGGITNNKKFQKEMEKSPDEKERFLRSRWEVEFVHSRSRSGFGTMDELDKTGKPVYFVSGNREVIFNALVKGLGLGIPSFYDMIKELENVACIDNKVITICNRKFMGIPFVMGGYNDKIKEMFSNIRGVGEILLSHQKMAVEFMNKSREADIIISHNPPYGVLDIIPRLKMNIGSKDVLEFIKKTQPGHVWCGHIHNETGCEGVGNTRVCTLAPYGKYKIFEV